MCIVFRLARGGRRHAGGGPSQRAHPHPLAHPPPLDDQFRYNIGAVLYAVTTVLLYSQMTYSQPIWVQGVRSIMARLDRRNDERLRQSEANYGTERTSYPFIDRFLGR